MASGGQTAADVSARFKANTTNVKSLIRRFELLASCASVPDVTKAYLRAGGYMISAQRQQQVKSDITSLRTGEKAIGIAQDIHAEGQQELVRRLLGATSKMASSGLLECTLESIPPHLPLPLVTKPHSLYNTITETEKTCKLSPDDDDGESTGGSNIGCALASTQHCASGPRQVLRRLGQTVKRKASFFLEQSQKLDDLPIRKSPLPRRSFGSGENVGKKVSKKVMEKVDAVRRASGDFWRREASIRDEEWPEVRNNQHIGDGENDGNGAEAGEVVVLAREDGTGISMTAGQKSITTECSCSSSSASYPLISPTTPSVMKEIPPVFIDSLLNRSIRPTGSIAGTADTKELIFYKIGPGRTPEIKQVPVNLERGMSFTGTLLTTDESKSPPLTGKAYFKSFKLTKTWQDFSGVGRSTGGDRILRDMHRGDGITRRKRITPYKVNVKSLIAKFRQVDAAVDIDSRKLQYRALGKAQNGSVETQFNKNSGVNEGAAKDRIWKVTPKRSFSIKKYMRLEGVQTTRSFILKKTEIKCDRRRGHRNETSLHGQPSKEHLLSGSGRGSIIAPESSECDSLDADEDQKSGEDESTFRASENEMSHSPNSNADVVGAWDFDSTQTGNGTSSLTSTDTIITRKNSSISHRRFCDSPEEYVEPKVEGVAGRNEYENIGREPRWSQSSWRSLYDYSQVIENSCSENWNKAGSQKDFIQPEYVNESRKLHAQLPGNGCGGMGRSGNTYRGTPAPAEFITRKEEDVDVASYSTFSSSSEAGERVQHLAQRGGYLLQDEIEMQSIYSEQDPGWEVPNRGILDEYDVDTRSGEDGDVMKEEALVSSETAASTSPDSRILPIAVEGTPLELTLPLLLNNTSLQRHHHRAHGILTRQHVGGICVPGEEDSGSYPIPRTASAARRLIRQHEAAVTVMNTVLWDGMGGLKSLAGIDVQITGAEPEWKRWRKMEGIWEYEYEYGREQEMWGEERKIGVVLPVRGVPIDKVIVPKPRNLVLKRVIERAVLTWA